MDEREIRLKIFEAVYDRGHVALRGWESLKADLDLSYEWVLSGASGGEVARPDKSAAADTPVTLPPEAPEAPVSGLPGFVGSKTPPKKQTRP